MQYHNPNIESSYKEHDIGQTLYDLVLQHKPKKIVEIGVLYGYSTVAMAMALDELGRGKIHAYDLWAKYPHKHSTMGDTASNIANYDLSGYVDLHYGDLESWLKSPEPFDLLHIDVSNTGETVEQVYEALKDFIAMGSIVVFEGGTLQRDNVEWMKKYNKKPMRHTQINYKVLNHSFPGISQMLITHKPKEDEKTSSSS